MGTSPSSSDASIPMAGTPLSPCPVTPGSWDSDLRLARNRMGRVFVNAGAHPTYSTPGGHHVPGVVCDTTSDQRPGSCPRSHPLSRGLRAPARGYGSRWPAAPSPVISFGGQCHSFLSARAATFLPQGVALPQRLAGHQKRRKRACVCPLIYLLTP